METFSVLLGNSPVTGEFPSQRAVTLSFDVFFDLCLGWVYNYKAGDLRCHRAPYDIILMLLYQDGCHRDALLVVIYIFSKITSCLKLTSGQPVTVVTVWPYVNFNNYSGDPDTRSGSTWICIHGSIPSRTYLSHQDCDRWPLFSQEVVWLLSWGLYWLFISLTSCVEWTRFLMSCTLQIIR